MQVPIKYTPGRGLICLPYMSALYMQVPIKYTPGARAVHEETLVLKLVGGEDLLLKCAGKVEAAALKVRYKGLGERGWGQGFGICEVEAVALKVG